jgi:hypothetical protein
MAQEGFPMPSDSTGLVQSVNNDAQSWAVCDKAPEVVRKSPKKAKKKRIISEAERERRRQAMMEILQRKRERKAQEAV